MITTLDHLKDGDTATIHEILGGHGIRHRLNHLGIHPQDQLEVIRSGYPGGPMLIKVHDIQVGIGQGMAKKIEVEVAP
jgi:Fe2+ transport system protein FeoA